MLNGGRQPKKLATRLLLCGDVTLATRAQYVVANNEHRFAGSEHTATEKSMQEDMYVRQTQPSRFFFVSGAKAPPLAARPIRGQVVSSGRTVSESI